MLGHGVLTGKGSAPSWMTKPSMRWVRTWGLTTAWGTGALSLSPCATLDKGRGRDRVGGDEKAADAAGRATGDWKKWEQNLFSIRLQVKMLRHQHVLCLIWRWQQTYQSPLLGRGIREEQNLSLVQSQKILLPSHWVHHSQTFSSGSQQQVLSNSRRKKEAGSVTALTCLCLFCVQLSPSVSTSDLTTVAAPLLEAVLSWVVLLRTWPRATACALPTKPCLAPTSWTGMWGGLTPPVVTWLLLGGAGRMGGGCRGGICTGKRCPWAVLGWIGTGTLSGALLACCNGCTTKVWALTLAFGATEPMG